MKIKEFSLGNVEALHLSIPFLYHFILRIYSEAFSTEPLAKSFPQSLMPWSLDWPNLASSTRNKKWTFLPSQPLQFSSYSIQFSQGEKIAVSTFRLSLLIVSVNHTLRNTGKVNRYQHTSIWHIKLVCVCTCVLGVAMWSLLTKHFHYDLDCAIAQLVTINSFLWLCFISTVKISWFKSFGMDRVMETINRWPRLLHILC